jgi:betaine-aldehyde dehydrogenase
VSPTPDKKAIWPMPQHRDLFYGGGWRKARGGMQSTFDPASGRALAEVAVANSEDVDAAVQAAQQGFKAWSGVNNIERGNMLREIAQRLRANTDELAWLDSINTGNPIREMIKDIGFAAAHLDYYSGFVHELKGETIPTADGGLNYTMREPLGVVARIAAYNHPLMFTAAKLAPVLAAGNSVVMKAASQAPLSSLRMAEIIDGVLPAGVFNLVTGERECGDALVRHPLVKKVALIGSIETGVAILRSAADKIMPVTLELGGKNPLVICADAPVDNAVLAAIQGMNFTWAGQSCGSTSRCFVHASLYDQVISGICKLLPQLHQCGTPTDPATTMGSLISQAQFDKVMRYIDIAGSEGARLVAGGKRPADPALANGWFVEPTVFADVTRDMRIFREEVFGPVLSIIKWDDEEQLIADINSVGYGLTASIYTQHLATAHRLAKRVESGYVWINTTGAHYLGVPFGGYKKSGMGREEGFEEVLSYTQIKNVHVAL